MAYCPACGASINEENSFCPQCGARVETASVADPTMPVGTPVQAAAQPATTQANAPSGSGGKGVLIGAGIVGALVLLGALAFFLTRPPANQETSSAAVTISPAPAASSSASTTSAVQPSSAATPPAGSSSSASAPAPAAEQPAVLDTGDVRATLPAQYVNQGYSWTSGESTVVHLNGPGNSPVADIVWADVATRENEAKRDSYSIGTIDHGASRSEVKLWVYYLEDGKLIYMGAADAATRGTLPLDAMGITVEELVSWIELYNVDGYVPARIVDDTANVDTAKTGSYEPFYGVWIGASKDRAEAEALAQEAQSKGLRAEVQLSSEWSNLNPEPWYVVTAGHPLTELNANTVFVHAVDAGYKDAYIKYSGEHL